MYDRIINVMKKLQKYLKKHKHILFFDFEGTQHSQEMIAIGAVLCTLNKKGRIEKSKTPFKIFVKAKNNIGRYVVNLTGITDKMLQEKGVSFLEAMNQLKKYCGLYWKRCLFVSFGNHDIRILNQTIAYNLNAPKDLCHQIHANYFDFATFISTFIKDENNCMMSLVRYCNLYKIETHKPEHDPEADALNLAKLFDNFVGNKELLLEEYEKVLVNTRKIPEPIQGVLRLLKEGKSVTPQDFEQLIRIDIE